VVAAGEDNAAVELVEDGVNGIVARSAAPDDLAAAIAEVHAQGPVLRERTAAWFAREAPRLTVAASLKTVLETYENEAAT
jgi:DNA-binding NarL/FixJ family response regulator